MRVDGSLMGIDDKSTSLLPHWKRGHFSLLFDGATTPATILLCDHAKKRYLNLSQEKKKHKPSLDDEVCSRAICMPTLLAILAIRIGFKSLPCFQPMDLPYLAFYAAGSSDFNFT